MISVQYLWWHYTKQTLALLLGVMVALTIGIYVYYDSLMYRHAVGSSTVEEVHVHADFLMYVRDERLRFTDPKYQSDGDNIQHADIHFHDGNDHVIHRHADGVTLVEFMTSLGFTVTDDCIITDTDARFCEENNEQVWLFVNGEVVEPVASYIIQEDDAVLLYYGDRNNPNLTTYLASITDDACIYSGTCPERGLPPPENCGLTCEVAERAGTRATTWLSALGWVLGW